MEERPLYYGYEKSTPRLDVLKFARLSLNFILRDETLFSFVDFLYFLKIKSNAKITKIFILFNSRIYMIVFMTDVGPTCSMVYLSLKTRLL